MAFSYTEQTGDGVTTVFPFAFSGHGIGYIRESDIVVLVNGVETEDFTFSGTNQIQFNTAPPAPVAPWVGPNIMIRRVVPKDKPYADFSRGNNFGQEQMNYTVLQQLYALHEFLDGFLPDGYFVKGDMDFKGKSIVNIGDLDMGGNAITGLGGMAFSGGRLTGLPFPVAGTEPVTRDALDAFLAIASAAANFQVRHYNDIRSFMDGQGGRPTEAQWRANMRHTDLTATIQYAVNDTHGKYGELYFPPGVYYVAGTVYVQTDTATGSAGGIWKPIRIKGAGYVKKYVGSVSSYDSGDAQGSTVFLKDTAGAMFSVNLNSSGEGVSAMDGSWHQFFNFGFTDATFVGVAGTQVTPLKGWSTRATLQRLSFINCWRCWDFCDNDIHNQNNYCDQWYVNDIYSSNIGDKVFRQSSGDSSIFSRISSEGAQSTATGGFELRGGRGMLLTGLLINDLPVTSSYIGYLCGVRQCIIQASHFEHNFCATVTAGVWTSVTGFLIEGGYGNVIANNEWYNGYTYYGTVQPGLTRPCVFIDGSTTPERNGGHMVYGNTFRFTRASGYDVYDTSRGSLVFMNIALNGLEDNNHNITGIVPSSGGSDVRLTVVGHGYSTGDVCNVNFVSGTFGANGQWTITKIDANTVSLNGCNDTAAWTSGGVIDINTVRALGYYRPSTVDQYNNYGSIFPHTPILASDLPAQYPVSGPNVNTIARSVQSTSYFDEVARFVANEDANGVIGRGPSNTYYSKNSAGASVAVGRIGTYWENLTPGSEQSGLAFYIRSNGSDTSAATRAMTLRGSGDLEMTFGGITTGSNAGITTGLLGLKMPGGASGKVGTVTLGAGGVATVNCGVNVNSKIMLTVQNDNGTSQGFLKVTNRVNGSSFDIASTNSSDRSTVAYVLIETA